MQQRVGGIAYLKIDGRQYETVAGITINAGTPMREAKLGTVRAAGYIEKPQIASVEGKIVLTPELSLVDFTQLQGVTVTVEGPNGTTFVLKNAWYSGEGTYTTEEGEVPFKFQSNSLEEIAA